MPDSGGGFVNSVLLFFIVSARADTLADNYITYVDLQLLHVFCPQSVTLASCVLPPICCASFVYSFRNLHKALHADRVVFVRALYHRVCIATLYEESSKE